MYVKTREQPQVSFSATLFTLLSLRFLNYARLVGPVHPKDLTVFASPALGLHGATMLSILRELGESNLVSYACKTSILLTEQSAQPLPHFIYLNEYF